MMVWVWLEKRVKVHQMPLIITSCNTHTQVFSMLTLFAELIPILVKASMYF